MFKEIIPETRGQVFTLEGVFGSFLIISAIVFALEATAITPLTASTTSAEVEEQGRDLSNDMLDISSTDDVVFDAILYYDSENSEFEDSDSNNGYVSSGPPDTTFQDYQEEFLVSNSYAYNIKIAYQNEDGGTSTESMVYQGQPSDSSVTTIRTFVLYDEMENTATGETLENDDDFYAPNTDPSSELYNVVEVQITVWKI